MCTHFGGASFHEDDYTIDCSSSSFVWVESLAVFGVVLVPIGVPAAFTYFMLRAKQQLPDGIVNQTDLGGAKLSPDETEDAADTYGFLTKDYRPSCWYFEVVTVSCAKLFYTSYPRFTTRLCALMVLAPQYARKLLLGGISVLVGRGTMAQTYFMVATEAAFLMLHMRTYPFVVYKHNVIEALGHCSLMLLYAASLILRNVNEDDWDNEIFPQEACEWSSIMHTRCVFLSGCCLLYVLQTVGCSCFSS
eukprot:COSAG02_NODE_207_length_29119_cov_41.071365_20_plen_248_part_00